MSARHAINKTIAISSYVCFQNEYVISLDYIAYRYYVRGICIEV